MTSSTRRGQRRRARAAAGSGRRAATAAGRPAARTTAQTPAATPGDQADDQGDDQGPRLHAPIVGRRGAPSESLTPGAAPDECSPVVGRRSPRASGPAVAAPAYPRTADGRRRNTMRETYHEELDDIGRLLVEMAEHGRLGDAARATTALLDADVALAEAVIAGDEKIDASRESSSSGASTCWPASSRSPPTCARSSPPPADRRDLERMGDLAEHIAKVARMRFPTTAVPAELRAHVPRDGPRRREHGREGRQRHRQPRRRGGRELETDDDAMDDAAPAAVRAAARPTTGRTASRRRSTSPCSAATTSGSPTTPSASPAASSTWSPASSHRPTTRELPVARRPSPLWAACRLCGVVQDTGLRSPCPAASGAHVADTRRRRPATARVRRRAVRLAAAADLGRSAAAMAIGARRHRRSTVPPAWRCSGAPSPADSPPRAEAGAGRRPDRDGRGRQAAAEGLAALSCAGSPPSSASAR